MRTLAPSVALWVCLSALLAVSPAAAAEPDAPNDADEQTLRSAGLATDTPALLGFFRTRSRTDADAGRLRELAQRFAADKADERKQAIAELIAWGPLAVPVLRQAINDLDNPEIAARARRCLEAIQGPSAAALPAAAARLLAIRKADGAAEALLNFLPFADDADVAVEITNALATLVAAAGEPDAAVLRALTDRLPARRAAACTALCRAGAPGRWPAVRGLLQDPNATVRLRAALALAEAQEQAAVPVLIDLLADAPPAPAAEVEECLRGLAGEGAPVVSVKGEDAAARRGRRDAWTGWWAKADGASLLAAVRKHTLIPSDRDRVRGLLRQLGDESFAVREKATSDLMGMGTLALPLLRQSVGSGDPEVARRAKECLSRIEQDTSLRLPMATVRLLALRKPAGAAEALLAYLPFAEDESRAAEVLTALGVLALHDGQPAPALVRALDDADPPTRAAAAEALLRGAGSSVRPSVRKLLRDADPGVRLRVAVLLTAAGEREAVPVLIDLLAVLSADRLGTAEEALCQLAGDKSPAATDGTDEAARKKRRDAWAGWWKQHGPAIDLTRLDPGRRWLGYTLLVGGGSNRLVELGRDGKPRWSMDGLAFPVDAIMLNNSRVLVAEYTGHRVTERDLTGKIVWQKEGLTGSPVNVQRLPNGNTFIATDQRLLEVDRSGKEIYSINNVGGITAAYKTRAGQILCLTHASQCVRLDTAGKQLKSFASNRDSGWTSGLDLLGNGRIIINRPSHNKTTEVDAEGKAVCEFDTPDVTTATTLPNGHILAASCGACRVTEVDRRGKVVWEHKETFTIFRARRR